MVRLVTSKSGFLSRNPSKIRDVLFPGSPTGMAESIARWRSVVSVVVL